MDSLDIDDILRKYNKNLIVNLEGYAQFISDYNDISGYDIDSIHEVVKNSLFWYDYFCGIENIIKLVIDDIHNVIEEVTILHGDTSKQLLEVQKQRKVVYAFRKRLRAEKKLCNKIHYHAYAIYRNGMKNINIYT